MTIHHYRFVIEGLNFKLSCRDTALIGFYTTFFIEASTYREAESKATILIANRLSENKILKSDSFLFQSFLGVSESYKVDGNTEINEGFTFFDMGVKDSFISSGKSILASLGLLNSSIEVNIKTS